MSARSPYPAAAVDGPASSHAPERDAASSGAQAVAAPQTPTADWAFRQYGPYVAAIALRLLGRHDEVDDLVQDVFIRALRGLASLRDPAAIKGWLATVTVRLAHKRLRRRRVRSWLGFDDASDYKQVAAPDAGPEQRALLAAVYAVLDELPAELRVAWTLRHIEGERLEAVAELCGCSLATAKRRIAAAHQRIEAAVDHG